jgi:hypothetical protein
MPKWPPPAFESWYDLPADKKRAHAIPYESNQYEIVNDTLYHFFQPRSKKKTYKNELIKQIAYELGYSF